MHLRLKIELKLYGPDDRIEEIKVLLNQAENELASLGGPPPQKAARRSKGQPKPGKDEKENLRKRGALTAGISTLKERIAHYSTLMTQIGGVISSEDARELILQKHHDLVAGHLQRYLQAEERSLYHIFENVFIKYNASAAQMEISRNATLSILNGFVTRLGYS
jgi:hypothetical protein